MQKQTSPRARRAQRARSGARVAATGALLGATALGFAVSSQAQEVRKDLGGPERLLAHLATDKPLYRPGETVYARAAVLDAFTRAPFRQTGAAYEVRGPRGDILLQTYGAAQDGIAPFSWVIPAEAAGGEYKLVIRFPEGFAPAETTFDVRAYRVPRLKTELEFVRKAVGPGDTVTATLEATRAEGGAASGAKVTAVATVDGQEVHRGALALDERGHATVTFKLPATIKDGEGTLACVIEDGGVQETAAKTIPIVVNRVRLETFPEGGDLVVGLPGRVYLEARTPKGKPADCAGRIVDGSGATLATFRTEHEGRGRVSFVPKKVGKAYLIALDEPAGVSDLYPLPEVKAEGFTLASGDDLVAADAGVKLAAASTLGGKAKLVLSCREREVASLGVDLVAGAVSEVVLTPPSSADGVLRATLLDAEGTPRAERLVFRRPSRSLKVELEATPTRAGLRSTVTVKIRTKDASGKPAPSTVTVSAVDDAVLETVERRERAPRLPAQALLGSEVRELRDALVYLEPGDAGARKTDLLLGTQGWRRFAFSDPAAFVAQHGENAVRALALLKPVVHHPAPPMAGGGAKGLRRGGEDEADGAPMEPQAPRNEVRPTVARAPAGTPPAPQPKAAAKPMAPAADRPVAGAPAAEAELAKGKKQRRGDFDDARRERAAGAPAAIAPRIPVVREFAHHAAPLAADGSRSDFTETLFWHAGIATDAQGEATISFELADSVTTYKVRADAFAADGAIGAHDVAVEARRPFFIEPKLPLEVSAGDKIVAPVALVNGGSTPLEAGVGVDLGKGPFVGLPGLAGIVTLGPDERKRKLLSLEVGTGRGTFPIRLTGELGVATDDVTRTISVVPAGFPIELTLGGRLEAPSTTGATTHTIRIPAKVSPGSLVTEGLVYPSPAATLMQAVEALLREPCGCFEQTSSSNYPNIMALQYLSTHSGVDPALVKRAQDLLDRGYKKLVSFECKQKGYEWFGGDPGHEALSAYGVLEFTDMAAVYPVDQSMLDRTRAWLLATRDGKGGFRRNPRALDTFGRAPEDVTDAYVVWALACAKVPGIEAEVALVRKRAETHEDAYFLALAANVLLEANDPAAATVLGKLASKQAKDGSVPGARTSITGSGGEALTIETTSLAILAFLRSKDHVARSETAMTWLLERAKGGRFGSTQSTILALKAIVAYDAAHATPRRAGAVLLVVDGKVYDEVPFAADRTGPIVLPSFAEALTPGEHKVELKLVNGAPMPYSVTVRYNAETPASAPACKVKLETSLAATKVTEGEAIDLLVTFGNATDEGLPMAVAILGLPGGLEARVDQLKELVNEKKIDFYETRGREVILYRRGLAPKETSKLRLSLVAAIPGTYTGPASRAYLYYTDEDKQWVPPVKVEVTPRG